MRESTRTAPSCDLLKMNRLRERAGERARERARERDSDTDCIGMYNDCIVGEREGGRKAER